MTADAVLDVERERRIGLPEAIFCAGKSVSQIAGILDHAARRGARLLLTRLAPDKAAALAAALDYDPVSLTGFFGELPPPAAARVAVVTAGTSDVPVAQEVARTLRFHAQGVLRVTDVGVAGLWRILARAEELRALPVVIVAAGMDGALPSVVAGLVPGAVIGLPTSVGYGVAEGGTAALHTMLASCSPGLTVVNIDNGYGAACAALRILALLDQAHG